MQTDKPRLGISTCLLGENVRYDGQHKRSRYLVETLGPFVEWVPVCPEVECGLPVPRESMHLRREGESLRLLATRSGTDHTPRMQAFLAEKIPALAAADLCGFVFKKSSPSSALHDAKYFAADGMPKWRGPGLFAKAFVEAFPLLPVEDEGRLNDAGIRENFLERLFVLHRWRRRLERPGAEVSDLVAFHAAHKLTLMAHSPERLRRLGRLAANREGTPFAELRAVYLEELMGALRCQATVAGNVNVLQHVMGYFKKDLDAADKREVLERIEQYRRRLIPLVVPVTLLSYFVRKYDKEYLRGQWYLEPFPAELMLRNHV
jgi:uncharacterized protein YbgA (DUF1722 family)/uncharacterized protein YbbK (DUF523 family)